MTAIPLTNSAPTDGSDPRTLVDRPSMVQRSTLYQQFMAERGEILRHKWLWSERVGYNVGFDAALIDWVHHHRAAWRAARRTKAF